MVEFRGRGWIFSLCLATLVIVCIPARTETLHDRTLDRTTTVAMSVLGSWAVGNILVGTPLYFTSDGPRRRFHEMNVAWNLVNLGIAGAALAGAVRDEPNLSVEQAREEQRRLESALLLNIGLDTAYIASGWALLERSQRSVPDSDRWRGYGYSLLVQGGFLLVFDLVFYLFQRNTKSVVAALDR